MVLGPGLPERSPMFLTHLTSILFSLFLTVDKCAFDYYPQLLILRESDDTDVLGVITSPPTRDSGHTYCNSCPVICYLSSVLLIIIVKAIGFHYISFVPTGIRKS